MPADVNMSPDTFNQTQMRNTRRSVILEGPSGFFTGRTMVCRYSVDLANAGNVSTFPATVSGDDDEICTVDVNLTNVAAGDYYWQLQDDASPPDRVWTGVLTVLPDLVHS